MSKEKQSFPLKSLLVLLIPLICSYYFINAFLRPGLPTGHEAAMDSLVRLEQMDLAVRDGHIPPRWMPDMSGGYGLPFFSFYPPLFYYVSEVFCLLGTNCVDAIKAGLILFLIFSIASMFFFARRLWGNWGGAVSAVLFIYSPYYIADIYIRNTLAEYSSFGFLPALFFLGLKTAESNKVRWGILFSLTLGLFSLSHNAILLTFPAFFAVYLLLLFFHFKKICILRKFLFYGLLGTALGAFFWFPALMEKGLTHVDRMREGYFAAESHLLYPKQLIDLKWQTGASYGAREDTFPFGLGLIHMIVGGISLILGIRLRKDSSFVFKNWLFFVAFIAVNIFLTVHYSRFIWKSAPILQFVQFPWRLLVFISTGIAILGGGAVKALTINTPFNKRFVKTAASLIIIILTTFHYRTYFKFPHDEAFHNFPDYHRVEAILWFLHTTASNEYLPRHVDEEPEEPAIKKIEIVSGEAEIKDLEEKVHRTEFTVESEEETRIRMNTFYYPGWRLSIDGQRRTIQPTEKTGLIEFVLNPGIHEVVLKFHRTNVRLVAELVSLGTLLALAGLSICHIVKKNY